MLDRLYKLLKRKPRRVELEWYEFDPQVLQPGLERSFGLPARRPSSKQNRKVSRKQQDRAQQP